MIEKLDLAESLERSARVLGDRLGVRRPKIGIILGSGLGSFADVLDDTVLVPFADVPHMRCSTASGHVGRFVVGRLGGVEVLVMQGRLHGYEGYSSQEVAYPVWLMRRLGVEILVTTNAVGAINEAYQMGDFCLISDHINFTGRNPVAGCVPDKLASRFFSLLDAYDPRLRTAVREVAAVEGVTVREGVYLGLSGPSFETPAEIRMFRAWGADTVAMSVVEEVIAARHVGMRVLGISLVTNMACGIEGADPDDGDMLQVGIARAEDFERLMRGVVWRVAAADSDAAPRGDAR